MHNSYNASRALAFFDCGARESLATSLQNPNPMRMLFFLFWGRFCVRRLSPSATPNPCGGFSLPHSRLRSLQPMDSGKKRVICLHMCVGCVYYVFCRWLGEGCVHMKYTKFAFLAAWTFVLLRTYVAVPIKQKMDYKTRRHNSKALSLLKDDTETGTGFTKFCYIGRRTYVSSVPSLIT